MHSDEMTHSLKSILKSAKKTFKYYTKVKISDKASRYFYSHDEYLKYLKNKNKHSDSIKNKIKNSISKGKEAVSSSIKKTSNITKSKKDSIEKKFKYIAKLPVNGNKFRYFYSNKQYQAYVNKFKNKKVNEFIKGSSSKAVNGFTYIGRFMESKVLKKLGASKEDAMAYIQNGWAGLTVTKFINKDKVDNFSKLKKQKKDTTPEEDQEIINPDYNPDNPMDLYNNNCSYCTTAYELRQRGYDVEANMSDPYNPILVDEIQSWWEGSEVVSMRDVIFNQKTKITNGYYTYENLAKSVEDELRSYGDGARGNFLLYWNGGGGHSVVWEVDGNDVYLRDCQNNKQLEIIDYLQYASYFNYIRTDNCEPTEDCLKTVRNR